MFSQIAFMHRICSFERALDLEDAKAEFAKLTICATQAMQAVNVVCLLLQVAILGG
jgi:hypothetical protein